MDRQVDRQKNMTYRGGCPTEKSMLMMTFLTNLEVTEILCIVRLLPEAKAGKEIPESSRLELLEKFPASKKT